MPRRSRVVRFLAALLCLATLVPTLRPLPVRAIGPLTDLGGWGLPALGYNSLAWGDADSDGDLDVLVTGVDGSGVLTATVYLSTPSGFQGLAAGLPPIYDGQAAWGDCNNDGDADVLLAGCTASPCTSTTWTAGIYENDGSGHFSPISATLPGLANAAVAWGDYDNDGRLDALLAGNDGEQPVTVLYHNEGSGAFSPVETQFPGVEHGSLAWGDYDADGDADLLLAGDAGGGDLLAEVWRNEGRGEFTLYADLETPTYAGAAAWGDYDNDGDLDLLLSGNNGERPVTLLYHNTGIGFEAADGGVGLPLLQDTAAAWGDVDGDGLLDLLLAGWDGSQRVVGLYHNDGTGAFSEVLYTGLAAVAPGAAALGDIDGDNDLDIVLGGGTDGGPVVHVYHNNMATGEAANTPPAAPGALAAEATVTGVSLAWKPPTDDHTPGSGLTYNLCVGTGASCDVLSPLAAADGWRRVPAMGNAGPALATTLTGLQPDTVYTWTVQAIDTSFAGGAFAQGVFTTMPRFSGLAGPGLDLPATSMGAAAWGDYDNDGDLDLFLAGSSSSNPAFPPGFARIYRNDGGAFTDIGAGLPALSWCAAAWGDYDNDDYLDLLVAGQTYSGRIARVYHNDGSGGFADVGAGLPGVSYGAAAWGDYDDDGDLDILLAGMSDAGPIARVYRNVGGGRFQDMQAGLPGIYAGAAAWGDYDGDGRLDILLTGTVAPSAAPLTAIYHNDGGGAFSQVSAGLAVVKYSAAAWGDYNNDGLLDLLVAGYGADGPEVPHLYENEGNGAFTASILPGCPPLFHGSVAWGDYDNDGRLDVLVTGWGPQTRLYHNDGGGAFSEASAGLPGVTYSAAAWGDYDNDGDLDLLLAGLGSGDSPQARLYHNNGNGPANTPPGAPTGLSATVGDSSVTLGWSAPADGQTPSAGLSYNLCVETAPGECDVLSPMADTASGWRRLPERGNAGEGLTATLQLRPATTYTWTVQAVDTAFAGGPFATRGQFTTGPWFTDVGSLGLPALRSSAAAWGDYDNDGDLDLVIAGDATTGSGRVPLTAIYHNDGSAFSDIGAGLPGVVGPNVAWGDYDADGSLDLLLAGTYGTGAVSNGEEPGALADLPYPITRIYHNDGAGHFARVAAPLPGLTDGTAAWQDYDRDGDLDILLAGHIGFGASYANFSRLYHNNGRGVFVDAGGGIEPAPFASAAWGDYDGDGLPDILLTGNVTCVYRNLGWGRFRVAAGLPRLDGGSGAWADYDLDGDLDLAISGWNFTTSVAQIFRNDGGAFVEVATLPAGDYGSAAWGDFDADGEPDLLVAGRTAGDVLQSFVYHNDHGTFTDLGAGLPGLVGGAALWGDYDRDGDLDVLLTGRGADGKSFTRLFRNNLYATGPATNTPPPAPENLAAVVNGQTVTLTWGLSLDRQTPPDGLTHNLRLERLGAGRVVAPQARADGRRQLPAAGGAWGRYWARFTLPPGQYRWSVQAVDPCLAGGPFAADGEFTVVAGTYLPALLRTGP